MGPNRKTYATTGLIALTLVLSTTACSSSTSGAQGPVPSSTASQSSDASPSGTATASSSAHPTPTPTVAAAEQLTLGKVSSYQEGFPYATGGLSEQWRSQIGWYVPRGQGAEVLGDLAAFVERDVKTGDQTLVVANSAGDVLYESPSLGLAQPQAVEPSLNRVRENGKEFITFYQIGIPADSGSGGGAGVPIAQLIVVDETGKATVIEEDVAHYRPRPTEGGIRALAFTSTDGSLDMQSGVAAGPDAPGYVRVLNPETAGLEPIPVLEGQSWLARIDGVDVYRSPGSTDPETNKPVATAGTPDWSTTFYDHASGSITFGPTYMSVIKFDGTCEIRDLTTGEPLNFEGAARGCAYETQMRRTFESAASPNGELFLMHWEDEQGVSAQWVVNLKTGEQKRIDPTSDFQPTMVSNTGDVYGRNTAGDATGHLHFPDQMQPQFYETPLDIPTAITDQGSAMFKYEDLPAYFAVPIQ